MRLNLGFTEYGGLVAVLLPNDQFLLLPNTLAASQIIKMNSDGSLDKTFGKNGMLKFPFFAGYREFRAGTISIKPNGHILVGFSYTKSSADMLTQGDFVGGLFELMPDGSFAKEFGNNGIVEFGEKGFSPDSIIILDSGSLLVMSNAMGMQLMRVNSSGELDGTYGTAGLTTFSRTTAESLSYLEAPIRLQDGTYVMNIANRSGYDYSDLTFARLDANGSLISSLDNRGVIDTFTPVYYSSTLGALASYPSAVLELEDQSLIFSNVWTRKGLVLVKTLPNGAFDPSFGNDGKVIAFPSEDTLPLLIVKVGQTLKIWGLRGKYLVAAQLML